MAWLWGVVAAGSLLLWPVWLALAPAMPVCPFRALTGLPCPSCGTTHAAVALLNGHPAAALAYNPLAAIGGIVFVLGGLLAPVWALSSLPLPGVPSPLPRAVRFAMVAVLAANWAWVIWRA